MSLGKYEIYCENYGNFMQSSSWANVKDNWKAEYITVEDNNGKTAGTILVLIKMLPFTNSSFLYAPRGPVCDMHNKYILNKIFEKIKEVAKKYNAVKIKLDPMIDMDDVTAIDNLINIGFTYHPERVGYDTVQCRENYLLDIKNKTAEEIFNSFKSKCRYNIRLSKIKGAECGFYGEEKLDDFIFLMKQTAQRDGFDIRNKDYFQKILRAFNGKATLCMCYFKNIPLSGALCIEYGKVMSYVYGCSSDSMRNYMPNYLMQWTMIECAVNHKLDIYDFCGIPYWYDKDHKNYGVYKFKQNFNGYIKTYAGEFDYSFKPIYGYLFDVIWKIKKHLP